MSGGGALRVESTLGWEGCCSTWAAANLTATNPVNVNAINRILTPFAPASVRRCMNVRVPASAIHGKSARMWNSICLVMCQAS